jgi:hypothetical protein
LRATIKRPARRSISLAPSIGLFVDFTAINLPSHSSIGISALLSASVCVFHEAEAHRSRVSFEYCAGYIYLACFDKREGQVFRVTDARWPMAFHAVRESTVTRTG